MPRGGPQPPQPCADLAGQLVSDPRRRAMDMEEQLSARFDLKALVRPKRAIEPLQRSARPMPRRSPA
jgi:hypothetical protein